MQSIALILGVVFGLAVALWLIQAWRMLKFCRGEIEGSWRQLRAELAARREIVPYLVAAAPPDATAAIDVIGNACDLAANVQGVRESSQAETRLSAALARLTALLDEAAGVAGNATLKQLRGQLADAETRIAVVRGAHNRQVQAFNTLLDRAAGRLLAWAQIYRRAEEF